MLRSLSSASLLMRNTPPPLNRSISKSSDNILKIGNYKKQKYDHVESKVKQYIKSIKDASNVNQVSSKRKLSKSCSKLLLETSQTDMRERPKTAETMCHQPSNKSSQNQTFKSLNCVQSKIRSQSESNLRCYDLFNSSSRLNKSTSSLSNIEKLGDASDDEFNIKEMFRNDEEIIICPEDLLSLVYKERHVKQEAKKVLNELQTNYDILLQKFAAAENALDKVRFGAKPPAEDGSRQEVFKLAEKVAEKIAIFEVERINESSSLLLNKMEDRKVLTNFSKTEEKRLKLERDHSDNPKEPNILQRVSHFILYNFVL